MVSSVGLYAEQSRIAKFINLICETWHHPLASNVEVEDIGEGGEREKSPDDRIVNTKKITFVWVQCSYTIRKSKRLEYLIIKG